MIFKNEEGAIRSGWKILITVSVFIISMFAIIFIVDTMYTIAKFMASQGEAQDMSKFAENLQKDKVLNLINGILQCISMIFSVVLFWKVFEKKPIRLMGLTNIKSSYRDLFIGLAFGAISMTLVFLILFSTNSISMISSFSNPNLNSWLLVDIVLFILVGINEEMFARGYCMSVLKQTKNKYVVVIVSSLIFSLMHSINPYMSVISYINLFLVGILFAYMFIKARNIWLPIGYHITWNYFQGDIFGFQVSGNEVNGMYNVKSIGSDLITGGNFGPEGGLIVTLIIILGLIFIWKFYNKSNDGVQGFLH